MKTWHWASMWLGLAACGSGDWTVTTWGEDYIEQGIPAGDFADGCAVVFDTFSYNLDQAALLDGDGDVVAQTEGGRFELTTAGPQTVGTTEAPGRLYDTVRFVVSPDESSSVAASGTLTCGANSVTFDWTFQAETTYVCAPEGLTLPAGGTATTELTMHGDHLFYDGLDNPDAEVRGQAIVDADADEDGVVTMAELQSVDVATLGYTVGPYSEVTDLGAFIAFLTRTLGHIDGEGHCQVDLGSSADSGT